MCLFCALSVLSVFCVLVMCGSVAAYRRVQALGHARARPRQAQGRAVTTDIEGVSLTAAIEPALATRASARCTATARRIFAVTRLIRAVQSPCREVRVQVSTLQALPCRPPLPWRGGGAGCGTDGLLHVAPSGLSWWLVLAIWDGAAGPLSGGEGAQSIGPNVALSINGVGSLQSGAC